MQRVAWFIAALLLSCVLGCAQNARTFTGIISDSGCGLKHMMTGDTAAQCTLDCVQMGAKFVLAVPAGAKVYALSDQEKAKPFAGQPVVVTGTLRGVTIHVRAIVAAPPATASPGGRLGAAHTSGS
ncbi:MAG: DUF5818 domain-containing protein [Terriglobia bacterium]